MKRFIFMLLVIISPFLCFNVYSLEEIKLYSPNYIIYDMTDDKIVKSSNVDEVTAMASLTKIMTTIVAIENINSLDDTVTYTEEMKKGIDFDASLAGLIVGNSYTYRDLLYASMLPSGADATNALAFSISGSVEGFVNLMNEKAQSLGMTNTHYVNVTGLDIDNHYSSVNDVFVLLKYSLQNELFKTIYTTKSYTLSTPLKKANPTDDVYLVESTVKKAANRIGLDASKILGSKTGYTDNAGQCISFIFNSNGHDYLGVTTKAKFVMGLQPHVRDAISIIDYIDTNYNNQVLINKGTLIKNINVLLSDVDKLEIKTGKDITKYLSNDYDKTKFNAYYEGVEEIRFNYNKTKPLGKIIYTYDNEIIDTEDVYLENNLNFSLKKFIKRYYKVIILIVVCLVILVVLLKVLKKKKK